MVRNFLHQRLRPGFFALAAGLALAGFALTGLALTGLALATAPPAFASEAAGLNERANNDVANVASLQRGARNFVNYCQGCHSAKYVRYNQLARDLGITEQQVIDNLMFGAARPTDTMDIAMRPGDAQRWFGIAPPDLSLMARSKGPDYIYNFLRTFYLDPTRPTGVNNLMLPNAAMPHVLWELQGLQTAKLEKVSTGTLTPEAYDEFVRDTVNFLDYIGEPMKLKRQSLGILVIVFLLVFGLFAYLLKQEIWRDVR